MNGPDHIYNVTIVVKIQNDEHNRGLLSYMHPDNIIEAAIDSFEQTSMGEILESSFKSEKGILPGVDE